MTARLATAVWISALRRSVEAAGGFAMVVAKGDPEAGSVLLILRHGNIEFSVVTKVNTGDSKASWQTLFEHRHDGDEIVQAALDKRRRFDPDLWIVELDVADAARFIDGVLLDH